MDSEIVKKLENCFKYYGNPQDVFSIIENNLDVIDFDDEDDVKELVDILIAAYMYTDEHSSPCDKDGKLYGETGVRLLKFLISKGFDVNFKFERGSTLLLKLAEKEIFPELFQKTVDLGADVYAETRYSRNVLTLSSEQIFYDWGAPDYAKSERLPVYIAEHFDLSRLDHSDGYGYTPLLYAVLTNKQNLIDVLLKRGVNADATGGQADMQSFAKMYGVSPFALACREGNFEIAEKLLKAGADEALCDAEGTPAMFSLIFKPVGKKGLVKNRKAEIVPLLKNLECTDSEGDTLLIKACTKDEYNRSGKDIYPDKNTGVISALLECGVNVNAANNNGETALHKAVDCSESEIVKELIGAGAHLNVQNNEGETPLMLACRDYAETTACYLVRKGADFNLRNANGETAIDIALENGLQDFAELCVSVEDGTVTVNPAEQPAKKIEKKSNLQKPEIVGSEVEQNIGKVINKTVYTVEKKPPVESVRGNSLSDIAGATPFALACRNGNFDFASKLLNAGMDEAAGDADGIPSLFYLLFEPFGLENESAACQNRVYQGKEKIVSILKNIETRDSEGDTLLMKAMQKRKYADGKEIIPRLNGDVIMGLIMRGANVNAVNNKGMRPIHYAAENMPSMFMMLIGMGADVNAQDGDGNTALMTVCKSGNAYDARVLLVNGADYKIKNNRGETAKDFAVERNLKDVLALMG